MSTLNLSILSNDTLHIKSNDIGLKSGYILRWSRFRKIKNLEIHFPPNGILLLDGNSGIGKTSILEAISFVLYDDVGNSCYPRNEKSSKRKHDPTWVEFTFPSGLLIYRQRRSNLLKVQHLSMGVDLIDDSAQSYINRLFGTLKNWLAGGYLRQRELCGFFNMSSDDKCDLLQQLSSSDNSTGILSDSHNFERLLQITSQKITIVTNQKHEAESKVKMLMELYLTLYNKCPENIRKRKLWDVEDCKKHNIVQDKDIIQQLQNLSILHKNKITSEINHLQSEITKIQTRISNIHEQNRQKQQLNFLIQQIQKEYEELPIDIHDKIKILESELADIIEQITLGQRSERKIQLFTMKNEYERQLNLIPQDESKYTSDELNKFESIRNGPNYEQIEQTLKDLEFAKEYHRKYQIYQQYKIAQAEVDNLQHQYEQYPQQSVNDQIENITSQLWALKLQNKKLICPKCSTDLQLTDGKLEYLEHHQISLNGLSVHELETQKEKLQHIENRYHQRNHIEKLLISAKEKLSKCQKLDNFDPHIKPQYIDINQDELIQKFRQKQFDWQLLPSNDISIIDERQKINNIQQRKILQKNIEQISQEYRNLPDDYNQTVEIKLYETQKDNLQQELSKYYKYRNVELTLQARKSQLLEQYNAIVDQDAEVYECQLLELQSKIKICNLQYQELDDEITAQIQLFHLSQIFNQHDSYQKQYNEYNKCCIALQKIHSTLITAEYIILDNVLSELNQIINEVLETVFTEPISVNIRSLRQLKTNDRIKPQINCQIIFDGDECTKITDLSGGEQIRISIALAIAFSKFSNSPFLLLDESLSTLDVGTKESTIEMLRKYIPNKLIIAVNHDTTTGVYDSSIHISK